MWAPLWSTEHTTIVGVGVYAWDENENGYVLAGPETDGYSQDLPMTFVSLRYVTGVTAEETQDEMAEVEDISDLVDVTNHDLSELEDALEEAGADTSELDLDTTSNNAGSTDGDGEEESPAEELAEGDGVLPFLSALSVLAVLALAALVGNSRKQDE